MPPFHLMPAISNGISLNWDMFHIARLLFPIIGISIVSCSKYNVRGVSNPDRIVKIMTYNTHHCNPPTKPDVIDIDGIAAAIKSENPDIVALQEIDVNNTRSGYQDEADILAEKLGYSSYYFARAIDFAGGYYGIAILSRYKLSETQTYKLPTDSATGGEPRVVAMASLTLPGHKKIHFACTHLDAQREHVNRILQIEEIMNITAASKNSLIIAGDFNAAPETEVIKKLDKNFIRTCSTCEITIPGSKRAIDFIAYRRDANFKVISHKVLSNIKASDHYPVVAELHY